MCCRVLFYYVDGYYCSVRAFLLLRKKKMKKNFFFFFFSFFLSSFAADGRMMAEVGAGRGRDGTERSRDKR